MNTDYKLLIQQAEALVQGVPHLTANLANISALLYTSLEDINWAGFYLTEGSMLVLGPFQGNPACVEIQYGKGVCGTAAATDRAQLVPDVHAFKGHIACDSASRSEIVIPIHQKAIHGGRLRRTSRTCYHVGEDSFSFSSTNIPVSRGTSNRLVNKSHLHRSA